MSKELVFRGRGLGGGGGGSQAQPTNTQDTLRSKDRVEIVLGLCQGPIKGLTNGHKSFRVGSTPYQNNDGSYNFPLFDLTVYPGDTPADPIVPVLGGYEDFRTANDVELTYNTPVTAVTTAVQPSQIIVRLWVDKLYRTGTDLQLAALPGAGNTYSTFLPNTLDMNIEYQEYGSGTWVNPFSGPVKITGKTTTGEPHEIRFIPSGTGPFTIRVTKLTNPDDTTNWARVFLNGHYEVTGGLFGLARSTTVNVNLAPATAVTRTTFYPNKRPDGTTGIDMLAIRILVNQLLISNTSGTFVDTVELKVEYKATTSGTWLNPFGGNVTITGKTTTPAVESLRWQVTPIEGTYDIRVTLMTADETDHYRQLNWESFQEIVGGPATYDGVAAVHLIGQATNTFTSVPDLSGEYDCLMCRIPSNYDPYTRQYTGTWDGTFNIDWTSNPAWCLYEMAMNDVWGAKSYWPNYSLDKYDAYAAGRFCDELVPDGRGGMQPRYTFNGVISEPRGIKDQLRYMAGVFNGTYLDDLNGTTRLVYDANEDAVAIFTRENVIQGIFKYTYTDPSTRYNYITGMYNDPNLEYQTVPRRLQADAEIARYGRISTEIALVGCTDSHEAVRRIAYKLISATTETEIVSFQTNRLGLMLRPYNVILVCDPDMATGVSGRISKLSADRKVVYFRDLMSFEVGITYTVIFHGTNPDYPASSTDPLKTYEITFQPPFTGGTYAIELSAPVPDYVAVDAPFTIGTTASLMGFPKAYRIDSIVPNEDDSEIISISAIEINRNKQYLADHATDNNGLDFVNFPIDITPPTNLKIETTVVDVNGKPVANVTAIWDASTDPRVIAYEVSFRKVDDDEWTPGITTKTLRGDIYNVPNGTYDFRVRSLAITGKVSAWVAVYEIPAGLTAPPDDVSFLTITLLGDNIQLKWTPVNARDLAFYWVRYSPLTDGTAIWEAATDLVKQVLATDIQVPAMAGTYFVKAVDTSGIQSLHAASAINLDTSNYNAVEAVEQYPTWPGTAVHLTPDAGDVLNLDSGYTSGTYTWHSSDLLDIYSCKISMALLVSAELDGYTMSDWVRLSDVKTLSGVDAGDYDTQVYIAPSDDGSTYPAWVPFATGQWTGRKFGFRVELISKKPNVVPQLLRCKAIIEMPTRILRGSTVFVPSTGLTVTFDPPFLQPPTVVPTFINPSSGDYFSLSGVTNAGFTIICYDNTATAVARYVNYVIVGYGSR